jgi:hypothetical protein
LRENGAEAQPDYLLIPDARSLLTNPPAARRKIAIHARFFQFLPHQLPHPKPPSRHLVQRLPQAARKKIFTLC